MRIAKLTALCVLGILAFTPIFSIAIANNSSSQSGQDPAPIALTSEPHHHLALQNEYVKLYQVEVSPGDSVRLHRHDTDAISLSLSDSLVTVHSPGKPDVQQKLTSGQVRLQALGFVHSTRVQGEAPFRNVTVELLLPQTGKQNRCAQVLAAQPLHCDDAKARDTMLAQSPQFESEQTSLNLVRVPPHERATLGEPGRPILIVALDDGAAYRRGGAAETTLLSGDFVWLDSGKAGQQFRNDGDKEVRLIVFAFRPR
jgi:hypothetical protein